MDQTNEKMSNILEENLVLKSTQDTQAKDLDVYKETLKRLYVVYIDQRKLLEVKNKKKSNQLIFPLVAELFSHKCIGRIRKTELAKL